MSVAYSVQLGIHAAVHRRCELHLLPWPVLASV